MINKKAMERYSQNGYISIKVEKLYSLLRENEDLKKMVRQGKAEEEDKEKKNG